MRRRDSLVIVACVALLGCALIVGAADGKKKGKGGEQAQRAEHAAAAGLDAGAISVKSTGQGRRVVVDGFTGERTVAASRPQEGQAGEAPSPSRSPRPGKSAIGSCSVTGLRRRVRSRGKSKEKGKKKGKKRSAASSGSGGLQRRSENPGGLLRPAEGAERAIRSTLTVCLQPWPNDYFTGPTRRPRPGAGSTCRPNEMPANTSGVHIDPTDINRADGFSPGNLITVKIPQVETQQAFNNSGLVPITDPSRYADANQAGRGDRRDQRRHAGRSSRSWIRTRT